MDYEAWHWMSIIYFVMVIWNQARVLKKLIRIFESEEGLFKKGRIMRTIPK